MFPEPSARAKELRERLAAFMDEHIYPNETDLPGADRSGRPLASPAIMEELKAKAKAAGLWNLFLPDSEHGAGLTNLEYAPLCEIMGRSPMAPEVFNCSAPDTGNMEVLARYGTPEQKERWLNRCWPARSARCFAMTEPDVASSDATNIRARIERHGDEYVINGRKWWTSGAGDPRCKICIFMGKTDPTAAAAPAAVDDPGADGHARRHGQADADRVRLRRRPARPRRGPVRERARAGVEHAAGRRPRLRDRPGPARAGPDPPLHAADRPGRAGAGGDVPARASRASPSASRWPSRARSGPTSPTRASRSSRPGC